MDLGQLHEMAERKSSAASVPAYRASIARVPTFGLVHRRPDNGCDLLFQSVDVRPEPPGPFSGR
jgi:hypothetical protein